MIYRKYAFIRIVFFLLTACQPVVATQVKPTEKTITRPITPVATVSGITPTPKPVVINTPIAILPEFFATNTPTVTPTATPALTATPTYPLFSQPTCRTPQPVSPEALPFEGTILFTKSNYADSNLWAMTNAMNTPQIIYTEHNGGVALYGDWLVVKNSQGYWFHNLLTGETKQYPTEPEVWLDYDGRYDGVLLRTEIDHIDGIGINKTLLVINPDTFETQAVSDQISLPDFVTADNPNNYFAAQDPTGQLMFYKAFNQQVGFYLALRNIVTDQEIMRMPSRLISSPYWLPNGAKTIFILFNNTYEPMDKLISLSRDGQLEIIGELDLDSVSSTIESSDDLKYLSLDGLTNQGAPTYDLSSFISIIDPQAQTHYLICNADNPADAWHVSWLDGSHLLVYVERIGDEQFLRLLNVETWESRTLSSWTAESDFLFVRWLPIEYNH